MAGRLSYSRADTREHNYIDILRYTSYQGIDKKRVKEVWNVTEKVATIAKRTQQLAAKLQLQSYQDPTLTFRAIAVEETGNLWALYTEGGRAIIYGSPVWYIGAVMLGDTSIAVMEVVNNLMEPKTWILPKQTTYDTVCIEDYIDNCRGMRKSLDAYNSQVIPGKHILGLVRVDDYRV